MANDGFDPCSHRLPVLEPSFFGIWMLLFALRRDADPFDPLDPLWGRSRFLHIPTIGIELSGESPRFYLPVLERRIEEGRIVFVF